MGSTIEFVISLSSEAWTGHPRFMCKQDCAGLTPRNLGRPAYQEIVHLVTSTGMSQ